MDDLWTENNGRITEDIKYPVVEVHDSETRALLIFEEANGKRHATYVYYGNYGYGQFLEPGCFTKGWKENPKIKYVWIGDEPK